MWPREFHLKNTIDYGKDEYETLIGSDGLIITTEWLQYRRPDWSVVSKHMARKIIFDGRNIFDPLRMEALGFEYYSIGRYQVGSIGQRARSDINDGSSNSSRSNGG